MQRRTEPLSKTVTDNVREVLEQRNLPVAFLVAETPIAERTLRRRMKGNSPWTTDELDQVAEALGLDADLLVLRHGAENAT